MTGKWLIAVATVAALFSYPSMAWSAEIADAAIDLSASDNGPTADSGSMNVGSSAGLQAARLSTFKELVDQLSANALVGLVVATVTTTTTTTTTTTSTSSTTGTN